MAKNLLSIPTIVESPFIICEIGGYTFGSYNKYKSEQQLKVTYPNYLNRLQVEKVNGTVNMYTLDFTYQVPPGGDPNLLHRIFSKAASDREISIKYGDWCSPEYIYREERCIITNLKSQLNMSTGSISYTLSCTSDAIGLSSTPQNFAYKEAKPSDEIIRMLKANKYGFRDVFKGMRNIQQVLANGWIATNDKKVKLLAQNNISPLAYLKYLVSCMINQNTTSLSSTSNSFYALTFHDGILDGYDGTYFTIKEIKTTPNNIDSSDVYEININVPEKNLVTQFSIKDDQSWAILYEYDGKLPQEEYTYNIDSSGSIVSEAASSLLRSDTTNEPSASKNSWWTRMTQFPIQASVTIKALTRPSILMTHVRLNVIFNGGIKHVSSGLYIIIKQVDTLDATGYKTTLTLLRVGEDK